MTEKLQTGAALNETFQFALHRWGTVVRIGWAPMAAVLGIAMLMASLLLNPDALQSSEGDPSGLTDPGQFLKVSLPVAFLIGIPAVLAMQLIMSGFMASIYRLVALGEEQPGFFHIRFDGPAMRVFIANLIVSVINIVLYGVGLLLATAQLGVSIGEGINGFQDMFTLMAQASAAGADPDPAALTAFAEKVSIFPLALIYAALPMIYINVRLAPFLAGSAAENRLILAGAFRLTAGNFWGVFGYYVLMLILMTVILFVFQIVMGIVDLLGALPAGGVFSVVSAIAGFMGFALTVAYQIFVYGLQFGGQGVIYRRLKTGA